MAMLLAMLAMPALGQQTAAGQLVEQQAVEQQKIAWLIDSVAALHDASFIRNGHAYDAAGAVAHLRLKLRFSGSRVKTAQDFINDCATSSSISGQRYSIRFSDGRTVDAATFLRGKLAQFNSRAIHAAH